MSATRDLIAAALTAAGSIRWQYPELSDELRELCARAMVQPDMGEVKNLVSAACNLMFDAGKLLGRRDAGADREVEDARSARTALLDYVRGVMAERDALIADNEPPKEAIGKLLADAMDTAAANGANSISMPDEYVEVAAWLCGIKPAPQPVGEICTDYHCPGDCGLEGAGYQHTRQPVSAAEVTMPKPNYDGYDLIDRFLRNNLDDDDYDEYMSGLHQYGDTREDAGYARGKLEAVPSGYWLAPVEPTPEMKSAGLNVEVGENNHVLTWTEVAAIYREMRDASLRGEVKP